MDGQNRMPLLLTPFILAAALIQAVLTTNLLFNTNHGGRNLSEYQLPFLAKPKWYDISLIPYFDEPEDKQFTFDGNIVIKFQATNDSNSLILHASKLTFFVINIIDETDNEPIENVSWEVSPPGNGSQFLYIYLGSSILSNGGFYRLESKYSGLLHEDFYGLFRSKYQDSTGVSRWLAGTQLATTFARRVFPCWDEPSYKAQFELRVAHEPRHVVLSNMSPSIGPEEPLTDLQLPGWTWTHFPRTSVPMSTYLVAIAVGDFSSVNNTEYPNRMQIWARSGLEQYGHKAAQYMALVVGFMEGYTGHLYSLPKLAQLMLPEMPHGAMENWGLVIYREYGVLYDETSMSASQIQNWRSGMSHELSHQWFGNKITMEWWNDIWLNEGLAAYFEFFVIDRLEPFYQMENQFMVHKTLPALRSDSQRSTPPMVPQAESVDSLIAIASTFNIVSYFKGASLVRFVKHLMSEEAFRKGLNKYLTDGAFQNVKSSDLWHTLGNEILPDVLPYGETLESIMRTWTDQPGFPVLKVLRTYGSQVSYVNIDQERFIMDKDSGEIFNEHWWIPITYTTQREKNFNFTVKEWHEFAPIIISNIEISDEEWILFNPKFVGFYRVLYDSRNWNLLSRYLNSENMNGIHQMNRGQVIEDALTFARAGILNYEVALNTTSYLHRESEYTPWAAALGAFRFLWDRLSYQDDSRHAIEAYLLTKLLPLVNLVHGFTVLPDDSHMQRLKRPMALSWTCKLEYSECNNDAAGLLGQWQQEGDPDDINPIHPDIRKPSYCGGMRYGGQTEYDFLLSRYQNMINLGQRELVLTAMGCAYDTSILQAYLTESIAPNSKILTSEALTVFVAVHSNYRGVDLALKFILENWQRYEEIYGDSATVGDAISGVAKKCNTEDHLNQMEEFYAANENSGMDPIILSAVNDSITIIERNIAWQAAYSNQIVNYLRRMTPSNGSQAIFAHFYIMLLIIALFLQLA